MDPRKHVRVDGASPTAVSRQACPLLLVSRRGALRLVIFYENDYVLEWNTFAHG